MQAEIDAQQTVRPVQILGINGLGLESGNAETTEGRAIPWLQPTLAQDVWTLRQPVYRDVIILGPGNELLGTFNLTDNNLSDPANYAALMNQLLEAANR